MNTIKEDIEAAKFIVPSHTEGNSVSQAVLLRIIAFAESKLDERVMTPAEEAVIQAAFECVIDLAFFEANHIPLNALFDSVKALRAERAPKPVLVHRSAVFPNTSEFQELIHNMRRTKTNVVVQAYGIDHVSVTWQEEEQGNPETDLRTMVTAPGLLDNESQ